MLIAVSVHHLVPKVLHFFISFILAPSVLLTESVSLSPGAVISVRDSAQWPGAAGQHGSGSWHSCCIDFLEEHSSSPPQLFYHKVLLVSFT